MSNTKQNIFWQKAGNTYTITIKGKPYIVSASQPIFQKVKDAIDNNKLELLPDILGIKERFYAFIKDCNNVIGLTGSQITYNGKPVQQVLADKVIQMVKEGLKDPTPFLRFVANIEKNPSDNSKEQLFRFLDGRNLAIDNDGFVIAYKSVQNNFYSAHGNTDTKVLKGTVNGQGQILNSIGATIEVDRESVDTNPNAHCSHGLHCGSYEYAKTFSQKLLLVRFDPKDAVSVPTDCSSQKIRVCKYDVISEVEKDDGDSYQKVEESVYNHDLESSVDQGNDYDEDEDYDEDLDYDSDLDQEDCGGCCGCNEPCSKTVEKLSQEEQLMQDVYNVLSSVERNQLLYTAFVITLKAKSQFTSIKEWITFLDQNENLAEKYSIKYDECGVFIDNNIATQPATSKTVTVKSAKRLLVLNTIELSEKCSDDLNIVLQKVLGYVSSKGGSATLRQVSKAFRERTEKAYSAFTIEDWKSLFSDNQGYIHSMYGLTVRDDCIMINTKKYATSGLSG